MRLLKSKGSLKEYPYIGHDGPTELEMAVTTLFERCPKVDVDWVCEVTRCTEKQATEALNGLVQVNIVTALPQQTYVRNETYFSELKRLVGE